MKKLFYTHTQENTVAKCFQFNLIYGETLYYPQGSAIVKLFRVSVLATWIL